MTQLKQVTEDYTEGYTLDELFGFIVDKKDELKVLTEQEKNVKDTINRLELAIIEMMEQQGIKKGGNDLCTVSITTSDVPTVMDWEAVYNYVLESGNCQLFQRRLAAKAFNELSDLEEKEIPGIEIHENKKLSVRKAR